MNKIIAFILSFVLLVSLAACGSTASSDNGGTDDTAAEANSGTAEDASAADESTDADTDTTASEKEISFTETVVVDNEACTIKITSIDPDNIWGYTLNAEFENKSSDKTYTFSVDSASINGVMDDPFFATDVTAGNKGIEEISFSDSTLEENGIEEFTDIELTFSVYDADDWNADDVAFETVHIYPYGEENATAYERDIQESDTVVLDNEYATVIVTGYEEDEIWGYTVNLYLVNKTDKNVMFNVENAAVNGYMADPFYATFVSAGKSKFSSMYWDMETLEEYGIEAVETIELELQMYDDDDWTGEYIVDETVVINP